MVQACQHSCAAAGQFDLAQKLSAAMTINPRPADRYVILQHFAQARRHMTIGEAHLARQYEIIAELERDGHDVNEAKKLFAKFIVVQAMHLEECRRLERELKTLTAARR